MSIDSDFLEEYESREVEALKKNIPSSDRLKLKSPIFNLVQDGSIWSQIALSGTVIFPLHPIPSDYFENTWNISISEFPELIQFIKDTQKIQFVLTAHPKKYVELDYLEPFLQEFSPPLYSSNLNNQDKKLLDLWAPCQIEIETLIGLSHTWQQQLSSLAGRHALETHIKSYICLRYYGLDEIADTFIENFVMDPNFAHIYLSIAENMILYPIEDPFKSNLAISIETIQKANEMGLPSQLLPHRPTFPEVGSFLMKKCTHYPESLEACKRLIDRYNENDLYEVHSALNEAVIDKNDSSIIQKKDELEVILDNVWEDTTIKSNATAYRYGIDTICGIVGHALNPGSGLMASVIPELINSTNSHYLDQFSELIAKKIATPYMATIYDFKKK